MGTAIRRPRGSAASSRSAVFKPPALPVVADSPNPFWDTTSHENGRSVPFPPTAAPPRRTPGRSRALERAAGPRPRLGVRCRRSAFPLPEPATFCCRCNKRLHVLRPGFMESPRLLERGHWVHEPEIRAPHSQLRLPRKLVGRDSEDDSRAGLRARRNNVPARSCRLADLPTCRCAVYIRGVCFTVANPDPRPCPTTKP